MRAVVPFFSDANLLGYMTPANVESQDQWTELVEIIFNPDEYEMQIWGVNTLRGYSTITRVFYA